MNFVLMDESGLEILDSWFADPLLRRWYAPPSHTWLEYVRTDPDVHAWMVYENDVAIGHVQVDIHERGVGYIGFAVNPELRGRGYGKRMLVELLGRPEIAHVRRIVGEVEEGNLASVACLLSVGFTQDSSPPTEEGFLPFVFRR